VAQHHPARIHPLLAEHALHGQPLPAPRMRVHGDRHAGAVVRLGDGAHDPLHTTGQARFVDGALQERGPDAGAGDAVGDVAHEHVHHGIRHGRAERGVEGRTAVMEEERDVFIRVAAGGDDDVEVDLLGNPLDPRDVPAQTDDGRVDDGGDPGGRQGGELGDGVGDPVVLTPPLLGVVLLHVRGQHENVLVHEHLAQLGGVDGAGHGGDLRHCSSWLPMG
jgi:hypothetical protein